MNGMKPWLTHGRNNPKSEEVFRNTPLSVGFGLLYNGDIQREYGPTEDGNVDGDKLVNKGKP